MNLIKRFKKRKQEELKNKFYNYIENAKHNIKMAINSEVAEFWYAKALGALDLAGNIGMIDTCQQFEIGNDVEAILKRVMNIIRYEQSLGLKNTEEK